MRSDCPGIKLSATQLKKSNATEEILHDECGKMHVSANHIFQGDIEGLINDSEE